MRHMTREHGRSASVVCGIDADRASRGVVSLAAALGERLGLRLVIVHVVPVPPPSPDLAPVDLVGAERGRRLLDRAAAAVPESVTRLEQGGVAGCLVSVAREARASLLFSAPAVRAP
jgi:nucleotide-binding universal stress UspA family protein